MRGRGQGWGQSSGSELGVRAWVRAQGQGRHQGSGSGPGSGPGPGRRSRVRSGQRLGESGWPVSGDQPVTAQVGLVNPPVRTLPTFCHKGRAVERHREDAPLPGGCGTSGCGPPFPGRCPLTASLPPSASRCRSPEEGPGLRGESGEGRHCNSDRGRDGCRGPCRGGPGPAGAVSRPAGLPRLNKGLPHQLVATPSWGDGNTGPPGPRGAEASLRHPLGH